MILGILQCADCDRFVSDVEARYRVFNTDRCACGGELYDPSIPAGVTQVWAWCLALVGRGFAQTQVRQVTPRNWMSMRHRARKAAP